MRDVFGDTIAEIVAADKRNFVLACDIGYGVFDKLRRENPANWMNTGIQEAATVGMASGMAMQGLRPWVYTITPFLLERPWEQIKLDVVQQNQNVKLVGYWDYELLGPTHISRNVKDLCKILGINLIAPQSDEEAQEELLRIAREDKPYFVYLTKC